MSHNMHTVMVLVVIDRYVYRLNCKNLISYTFTFLKDHLKDHLSYFGIDHYHHHYHHHYNHHYHHHYHPLRHAPAGSKGTVYNNIKLLTLQIDSTGRIPPPKNFLQLCVCITYFHHSSCNNNIIKIFQLCKHS